MVRRLKALAVMVPVALIAFGVMTAVPFLWNVLALAWFVHLKREANRNKINNPSPTGAGAPQEGVSAVGEGVRRVDSYAGGAMYIIHPEPVPAYDDQERS